MQVSKTITSANANANANARFEVNEDQKSTTREGEKSTLQVWKTPQQVGGTRKVGWRFVWVSRSLLLELLLGS